MENGKEEFNRALSRMVYENAGKRAIRHLFDVGLTPEEIAKRLTYPQPLSVIEREIREYIAEKESGSTKRRFVQEKDEYGRVTYRLETDGDNECSPA